MSFPKTKPPEFYGLSQRQAREAIALGWDEGKLRALSARLRELGWTVSEVSAEELVVRGRAGSWCLSREAGWAQLEATYQADIAADVRSQVARSRGHHSKKAG